MVTRKGQKEEGVGGVSHHVGAAFLGGEALSLALVRRDEEQEQGQTGDRQELSLSALYSALYTLLLLRVTALDRSQNLCQKGALQGRGEN